MAHPDIAALVQEAKARKWADRDLTQHADDLAQELDIFIAYGFFGYGFGEFNKVAGVQKFSQCI